MGVRVNEGGHDDAALRVNEFGFGVLCPQLCGRADFFDLCAVDHNAAVGQIGKRLRAGDELTVGENVHSVYLL